MRRKWLRAVAVFLVISLLLSDNSLCGSGLRVYATEDTNLIEDNENTAPSDNGGSENEGNDDPDEPDDAGDGDTDTDNSGDNGGYGSGNGGSGDNGGSSSGNGDSNSSGGSGSGNGGNTGSNGNTGGSDNENGSDENDGTGDGPDADPTDPSDPADPDAAKEDEILADGAFVEDEMLQPDGGIMLFTEGEVSKPADSKPLKDVQNQDEYAQYYTTEYIYYLATAEDFMLLQKLCEKYDFEGIKFQIGNTGTEKEWDISKIPDLLGDDSEYKNTGFEGFGSEAHPFRGTMSCYYTSGSLTFKLDKPLFAYLGEGAEIYQFDFKCEDSKAAAIAQHIVVSGEDKAPIKIHDVNITGVIKNSGGNAGMIAGEIGENVKVVIQNVDSKVSTITGENAGTIAGKIGKNAGITIKNVKSEGAGIEGKYAGGIAGIVGDGVTITQSGNAWSAANVTGSTAAGGCFGMLQGSHTWNVSDNTLGNGFIVKGSGAKGQFAGILDKGSSDIGTLTIESSDDSVTVNAQIDGSGSGGGGIIGICKTDTMLVCEKPLTVTGTVKNSGAQAGGLVGWIEAANENVTIKLKGYTGEAQVSGQAAGGIFGKIEHSFTLVGTEGDDQKIPIAVKGSISGTFSGGFAGCIARTAVKIPKMTVASTITGTQAGGIVGLIKGGKCIISGASVTGESITGSSASGSIVGEVQNDEGANKVSALALDGTITLGIKPSGGSCGSIVGKQSECLIYLTGAGEEGNVQLALSGGSKDLEEIGFKEGSSYGGVFRNQKSSDDKLLIGGDGCLDDVGKVNGYAVSGSSGTWTLKGTAGMESLAIALNTQGNFGMEAFGSSSPNPSGVPALLTASYTLDGNADISYDKTGIITINRNDKESGDNYIFRGSLQGAESGATITQNSSVKQPRTGIFSTLGGTASFSNLTIDGEVSNASGTGGIAYQSVGDGITLTDIVMKKKFTGNKISSTGSGDISSNSTVLGGIMAKESGSGAFTVTAENVTLASEIEAGAATDFSGFITGMNNAEVHLDDIKLGGSLKSTGKITGGFLGKGWYWMSGEIGNVTVQPETSMNISGSAGGLLYVIESASEQYVTFDNIKLGNLSMTAGSGSALLVVNGQNLVANIVDYSCAGTTVTPGGGFDEVVYVTKAAPYTGIISLHDSTKNFPDYHYENQATYTQNAPSGNSQSVYYYDIFQKIDADGNIMSKDVAASKITADHVLDTPEKMLIWSAVHNATNNDQKVKSVFKKCFAENDYGNEEYTIKGSLDLRSVSFYPAPSVSGAKFTGTNNAKVIFHAADMNDIAGDGDCTPDAVWQFPDNSSDSQHYRLHGGLLLNPTGGVTATDLTLQGTVANLGTDSGALIGGTLSGGGTFRNITLNNLWIDRYNKENEAYGLLISKIAAGTGTQTDTVKVSFDGIVMGGYESKQYTQNGTKAAAALIGTAGGADVTNLELLFKNMQIADDADNSAASPKHNGDVLAYASFIYSYDYTNDADLNKGSGRYLFSKEESANKVTWGKELDSLTEYWVYDREDPHIKLQDNGEVPEVIRNAAAGYYKPYVYMTKQIEVNPKPGDIVKGCGTYEDPYVIDNEKQFLTLYRYLSMKAGEKTDFFNNWKVNKLGSDASLCDKADTSHTEKYTFTSSDTFPNDTQRALSRAYYQLGADIDLSGISSGNYKIIADSFVGFGTEAVPFTGVWYGKKTGEDSVYTVTLPSKTNTQIYDTFGFLQYAKGAVVKDMKICTPQVSENKDRTTIKASGAAGGVIGCILGGDNIIDNVTVDVDFVLSQTDAKVTLAAAGGYVGRVKKGGLILRNVTLPADVSEFVIYNATGTEITKATESTYKAYYGGALCGRVEDGYVIYEGSGSGTVPLWKQNETAGHGNLPLIPDYDIVNGAYLDDKLSGDGAVSISDPGDSNKISVTLPNAAALQVMSMAMNADALNMMPDKTKHDCGYTDKARSRRAQYDHIGNCGNSAPDDYKTAVTCDNVMTYPYLYRYFGITGNYGNYIINHYGILNASGKIDGNMYHTTWNLASNGTYDMTEFGQAFRGIGALYDAAGTNCSTFRGNFNGNGSTVTIELDGLARNYTDTVIFPATLRRRGLFNTIIGYSDASLYEVDRFTISNLKLKGSIQAVDADSKEIIKVLAVDAGGIAGRIDNAKVNLAGIEVTEGFLINAGNTGYKIATNEILSFGGLVGTVKGNQDITVSNCAVKGGSDSAVVSLSGSGFAGGIIGFCNLGSDNTLTIEQTENGVAITGAEVISKSENAGGIVGHVLCGKLTVKGIESYPVTVENSTVSGYWQAAGIVGETREKVLLTAENIKVAETKLTSYKCTGGVIGEYGAYKTGSGSTIKNIEVIDVTVKERKITSTYPYSNETGQGGIVGKCLGYLTLENVSVGTENTTDTKVCTIQSVDNARQDSTTDKPKEHGVGGLAGCVVSDAKLTLNGCTVKDAEIKAGKEIVDSQKMEYPASAGGAVGYSTGTIILAGDVTTENLKITTFADATKSSKHFAAGGIVGCLRGNMTSSNNTYSDHLHAVNNTVTGMYAGGVAGYAAKSVRLQGKAGQKLVESGTVSGGLAAGGLFGECNNGSGSNLALNPENGPNEIIVSGVTISAMDAGGVAGVIKASDAVRMEKILVENCAITGKIPRGDNAQLRSGGSSVGGIVGELSVAQNKSAKLYNTTLSNNTIVYESAGTTLETRECSINSENHIAVGGLFGNVKKRDSSNPDGTIYVDEVLLSDNNRVGVCNKMGADPTKVMLVKKNGSSYELSDLEKPPLAANKKNQDAVAELTETYGSFVGTLIGTLSSENVTIDMMHVSTQADTYAVPVLSQSNPPVVDVGTLGSQGVYGYRQNCHILYGIKDSGDAKQNIAHMNQAVTDSSNLYNNLTSYQTLLAYYRLTSVGDWNDAVTAQSAENLWKDVYPFKLTVGSEEKTLPILVCRPGIRSLNETITSLSDIMTNVSGLSASNVDILTVTATPKVWEVAKTDEAGYNGIDAPDVDGSPAKAHISVTKTTDKGYTFAYLSDTTGSDTDLFDRYDSTAGTLTYTELTYTYEWSDSGSRKHTRTFALPVFVEEPLLVEVQTAIQAGKVTSVEAMGTEKQESVVMANDSDYTLLLEYSFGDARTSYDMTMPKEIWRTQQENPLPFADGTRLLLIDVTGGSRAYYYTVDNTTPERIPFELFEDSNGTAYKDKKLNRSDFEGTEQYLLQVLLPDSVKTSAENTKYDIHAGICEPAPEVLAKMQGELEKKIAVDSIPGIKITLDKSGGETVVNGTLSANGELIFDMQFSVKGEQAYWQKKGTIDSANNGKYLDLSCYLMNEAGTERVTLPVGTNFQYRLDAGGNYSDWQIIPDQSGVYYYKEIRDKYEKEDSKFLIRDIDEAGKIIGVTEDTTVSLQMKLKLPAELSGLTDSHYTVCIDLLRTDDPDYPAGYEDALGEYRRQLGADVVPDIGFAVRVDEEDWEKLGINTYEGLDDVHEIPFKAMLDFREILRYASGDTIVEQWADKDYHIAFEILSKSNAAQMTYGETPFAGSLTDANGNPTETMKISMDGGDSTWKWDSNSFVSVTDGNSAESSNGRLDMKYRFTKDQIKKTADEVGARTPIVLTGKVIVNGQLLKQLGTKEEFEKYLTNYRMKASLRIKDRSDALPGGDVTTYDYFVYTVTRLKTDM